MTIPIVKPAQYGDRQKIIDLGGAPLKEMPGGGGIIQGKRRGRPRNAPASGAGVASLSPSPSAPVPGAAIPVEHQRVINDAMRAIFFAQRYAAMAQRFPGDPDLEERAANALQNARLAIMRARMTTPWWSF